MDERFEYTSNYDSDDSDPDLPPKVAIIQLLKEIFALQEVVNVSV